MKEHLMIEYTLTFQNELNLDVATRPKTLVISIKLSEILKK